MSGTKFDSSKPDWSLLDLESMNEVLKVLSDGAEVHGRDNWKRVKDAKRRYANAAIRHAMRILAGEDRDPEHGTLHAAHVAVNGLFLTFFAFRSERARQKAKEASFARAELERNRVEEKQRVWDIVSKDMESRGIAVKEPPRSVDSGQGDTMAEAVRLAALRGLAEREVVTGEDKNYLC